MKNNLLIKKMAGVGVLAAIVIILQSLSSLIKFGPFSITLALIPIAVGAILYGPLCGAFLGLCMGVVTLFDAQLFISMSPFGTVVTCILKASLAGLVAGYVNKALYKKNKVLAIILASFVTPIVNTGIFALFCFTIIRNDLIGSLSDFGAESLTNLVFVVFIGVNFLVEVGTIAIFSPTIVTLIKIITKNYNLGFAYEEKEVVHDSIN